MSTPMYNLSELIKTDCCIDCGTNEKLREVVGELTIPERYIQTVFGVHHADTLIEIINGEYITIPDCSTPSFTPIPLTSINIDL